MQTVFFRFQMKVNFFKQCSLGTFPLKMEKKLIFGYFSVSHCVSPGCSLMATLLKKLPYVLVLDSILTIEIVKLIINLSHKE